MAEMAATAEIIVALVSGAATVLAVILTNSRSSRELQRLRGRLNSLIYEAQQLLEDMDA